MDLLLHPSYVVLILFRFLQLLWHRSFAAFSPHSLSQLHLLQLHTNLIVLFSTTYFILFPYSLDCVLCSQVDSSVGGKTGINHRLGKNLIGAFYQPQCVLIDTDTLNTLPDRELASGLAEVIKYGLIRDAGFFEWQEKNMQALMAR